MQGYPPQHGYMVPPMAGQQQMYQQQPGMYQQPPQGYQQCVPTQIALFPSRASAECRADPPPPSRDRRPAGCPPSRCTRCTRCNSSPRVTGRISSTFPSATSATGQRCAHSRPDARREETFETRVPSSSRVPDRVSELDPYRSRRMSSRSTFAPERIHACGGRVERQPVAMERRAGASAARSRARNARIVLGARNLRLGPIHSRGTRRVVVVSRMNSSGDRAPTMRLYASNEFPSVDKSLTSCPHPSPPRPRFAGCDRDKG